MGLRVYTGCLHGCRLHGNPSLRSVRVDFSQHGADEWVRVAGPEERNVRAAEVQPPFGCAGHCVHSTSAVFSMLRMAHRLA